MSQNSNSSNLEKFTKEEELFYDKHFAFPRFGKDGQQSLKKSSILVVGAGGLGSPALFYLAGAGVGNITIVDSDCVELGNLQRQILYGVSDVGKPKAQVALERIQKQNAWISVTSLVERLDATRTRELIANYDLIVDCTDNLTSKFLLHDECYRQKKNFITASIFHLSGQLLSFHYKTSSATVDLACWHCLWKQTPKDNPPANSIIGTTPGIVGVLQAQEVIKVLLHWKNRLQHQEMLTINLSALEFLKIKWHKNPTCHFCRIKIESKDNHK
ncbi:MAG: HesA/MoeB/ThiF family protein [Oligoflexia bacterium]|nr:HesA/MoeB/ThiF family protein [Oligoflexia bacterium]MBF0364813.1 HesA/MoeB/ThiF family protein [Oligoflexia bacterium]